MIGGGGLIQLVVDALQNTACPAFDEFGALSFDKLVEQIPKVVTLLDQLNGYPILDPLIPDIPRTCVAPIDKIVADLKRNPLSTNDIPAFLCALDDGAKQCLGDFGKSLENVEWVAGVIPDSADIVNELLSLLPTVCMLVGQGSEAINPDQS